MRMKNRECALRSHAPKEPFFEVRLRMDALLGLRTR